MVRGKQPDPEHKEDEGVECGLPQEGRYPSPRYIDNTAVERVHTFKYLGLHLTNTLTWRENTMHTIKKAHQRLYILRKLKGAGMFTAILESFYKCVVESRPGLANREDRDNSRWAGLTFGPRGPVFNYYFYLFCAGVQSWH